MAYGPLVAIVGETASGKSALAMQIARKYNGELICADARTIYKGFDIGSAKPSKADQREVRHHLLDAADPKQGFNAAAFKELAQSSIDDIASRGKLPILVGGTGLYIDGLLFDYKFMPSVSSEERAKLNDMTNEELVSLAENKNIDLSNIDIKNKRRVIRAIETQGQHALKNELRPNTLVLGIKLDRQQLLERIEERVTRMIEQGLEREVRTLAEKYGWEIEAMKGIGYREWREYFNGITDLQTTHKLIVQATYKLAKRQRTWFKRNKNIQWLDSDKQAEKILNNFLGNKPATIVM